VSVALDDTRPTDGFARAVHQPDMRCLVPWIALLGAGCPDRAISKVVPVQTPVVTKTVPVSADIDLLFVIDNSGSTQDKQTVFAQNYQNFVAALDRFPTGRPNLHVGVVTSTVDTGGQATSPCHPASDQTGLLQNASRDPAYACTSPTAERFLVDIARPGGGRTTNYSGSLDEALSCISHVNDNGCGFEAPLEAMKRALDGSRPENAGFVRTSAFLAVVILTDEDDCSAAPGLFTQSSDVVGRDDFRCAQGAYLCDRPISPNEPGSYTGCRVRHDGFLNVPSTYARFLSTVKDPSLLAVALIAGEPTTTIDTGPLTMPFRQDHALLPSCNATINGRFAIGRPSLRLHEFLDQFGNRGLFSTVCQADYTQAVADIGTLLFRAISPCLEGTLDTDDTDPANPGLQPDCTVSELQDPDTDAEIETLIPRCRMAAEDRPELAGVRACWWVAPDPVACSTETQLELRVERSAAAAPNSVLRVSCAAEPR
jgi:hypothetical protein